MSLLEEMSAAARHIKAASKQVADWRVRDALAGAGTAVACAILLQEKIGAGKLAAAPQPPQRSGNND